MKQPVIQFYTVMDGEVVKQFKCQIDRGDGFTAVGSGATVARALLEAALIFANREKQEFNRAEHDKAEASKHDYSMNATRYAARRDPPLHLIDTDTILDIQKRNGEKFAVDCATVLEAFNGHLKVKFLGTICPHCGSSDTCWIPVRNVEEGAK